MRGNGTKVSLVADQMYLHVPHFLLWYGSDAPCLLHRLAHKTEQLEPATGVSELDTL